MRSAAVVLLLASVIVVAVRWGTFTAGGSDSYCYLHQAERWASGRLQVPEPLALEAPWPNAALTFAPSGHRPSVTVPGAIVPICPPGLSMAMAPLVALFGADCAFLLIPLFGALLVGGTYIVGSGYGPRVGLASAVLMASSPIFLYQVVQPMSDVPAAALWILAVAAVTGTRASGPVLGGLAAAGAVLVRPNLLPLAVPLALFLLFRPERLWRSRMAAAEAFAASAVPGVLAVALIHNAFYGSPVASGYGATDTLFSSANVIPNVSRYASWLTEAQTPAWLAAVAAPFLLPGALTRLLVGMVAVNVAGYLPYVVFDDWSYVRFLLPAIPCLLILMVASVDAVCRRLAPWTARPVIAVMVLILAVSAVREAERRQVFRLRALESRYERTGRFVARRLPPNAVVITSWQSGSVRFYSGRRTLLWDALDPGWLDRALDYLRGRGFEPFLLFESWEEPLFRQRFGASELGRLDWPPIAEIAPSVRIYRPDDRERYVHGIPVPTEYAR